MILDSLNTNATMILINTIYLKEKWKSFFDEIWKKNNSINLNQTDKYVLFIVKKDNFHYFENNETQVIS